MASHLETHAAWKVWQQARRHISSSSLKSSWQMTQPDWRAVWGRGPRWIGCTWTCAHVARHVTMRTHLLLVQPAQRGTVAPRRHEGCHLVWREAARAARAHALGRGEPHELLRDACGDARDQLLVRPRPRPRPRPAAATVAAVAAAAVAAAADAAAAVASAVAGGEGGAHGEDARHGELQRACVELGPVDGRAAQGLALCVCHGQ